MLLVKMVFFLIFIVFSLVFLTFLIRFVVWYSIDAMVEMEKAVRLNVLDTATQCQVQIAIYHNTVINNEK